MWYRGAILRRYGALLTAATGIAGRRTHMKHTPTRTETTYTDGHLVVHERNNPDAWVACGSPVPVVE